MAAITLPSPDDPEEALAAVVALRRLSDQLERAAVAAAIAQGWSWSQVAAALGVTKQAAHQKFARILSTEGNDHARHS